MNWSAGLSIAACLGAASATTADIPTVSSAELSPGAKPLLLPLHLPGYDLRVLDERKPVTVETPVGKTEVRLPIYVYLPAPERRDALRQLRDVTDDLRRASHEPDRTAVDLEALLARFERALTTLGAP